MCEMHEISAEMDKAKVSAPGLDQSWDLRLPLLPPWTHGCPARRSRLPTQPGSQAKPRQAAKSNPKLVLDMNHSSTGSCFCVQLVICAILLRKAAARRCREKRRLQRHVAECTTPCLGFPACKARDRGVPYAKRADGCRESGKAQGGLWSARLPSREEAARGRRGGTAANSPCPTRCGARSSMGRRSG